MYFRSLIGKWELHILAAKSGEPVVKHLDKVKLVIETQDGQLVDRNSPWAQYVICDSQSPIYHQHIYNPSERCVIIILRCLFRLGTIWFRANVS